MSNQHTPSDNELIAAFMNETLTDADRAHNFTLDQLPYRTNWSWLMPVVERIESLGFKFATCRRRVDIHHDNGKHWVVCSIKEENKINSVYKAVVEFIKWYNSNPKEREVWYE